MNWHQSDVVDENMRHELFVCTVAIGKERGLEQVELPMLAAALGWPLTQITAQYPDKDSLLKGLLGEMVNYQDRVTELAVTADPEPYGVFSRAYVETALVEDPELPWSSMSLSTAMNTRLTVAWDQ